MFFTKIFFCSILLYITLFFPCDADSEIWDTDSEIFSACTSGGVPTNIPINPFHATGLFLYPLKTSEN